jgi:Protein of unknown function (DUF2778)
MSWLFVQRSGELFRDGSFVATCYSGRGVGCNNPELQNVHNVGPIPAGRWLISGPPEDSPTHGLYVLHLFALPGTETFGRSGFLLHGDLIGAVGKQQASLGCIVANPAVRRAVWDSGDRDLLVVSEPAGEPVGG